MANMGRTWPAGCRLTVRSNSMTAQSQPNPAYVDHLRARGFELHEELGRGLSGAVLRATQTSLERPVAVKFCDGLAARRSEQLRKRFHRESRILARVSHPAVPYVIVAGTVPVVDVPFMVMEFIDGRRLRDEIAGGRRLPHEFSLRLSLELLDALTAVHRARIVHRDISPENIMVSSGRCVLIDFSIGFDQDGGPGVTRATTTGEHLGRADYMAPEQAADMGSVDERCDVYAAGVVLLEMLTGSPKFVYERLDAQLGEITLGLRDVLRRALAPDLGKRFQTAAEFRSALSPFGTTAAVALNAPMTAVCASHRCPGASWTPNGYYEGPRICRDSTDSFCDACGLQLKRSCERCGNAFKETSHCGNCGSQWYSVPECATCGSWLKLADMGADTAKVCCSKGRRGRPAPRASAPPPNDDIPF